MFCLEEEKYLNVAEREKRVNGPNWEKQIKERSWKGETLNSAHLINQDFNSEIEVMPKKGGKIGYPKLKQVIKKETMEKRNKNESLKLTFSLVGDSSIDIVSSNFTVNQTVKEISGRIGGMIKEKAAGNIYSGGQKLLPTAKVSECKSLIPMNISLFSISGMQEEYTRGIHKDMNVALLLDMGFELKHKKEYGYSSISSDFNKIKSECSENAIICVGAWEKEGHPTLKLCAFGNCHKVFTVTDKTPKQHNGVYWYMVPSSSFGFSFCEQVSLCSADTHGSPHEDMRLSWHLDQSCGGYRCGTNTSLNSDTVWRKVIYVWDS